MDVIDVPTIVGRDVAPAQKLAGGFCLAKLDARCKEAKSNGASGKTGQRESRPNPRSGIEDLARGIRGQAAGAGAPPDAGAVTRVGDVRRVECFSIIGLPLPHERKLRV